MNKRLRSRVLAASIISSTVLGTGTFLFPERSAMAQDRQTAEQMLDRAQNLYDQKNYPEARRILADIDPGQLREDLRNRRADLLKRSDDAIAQGMAPNAQFDSAAQDVTANRLASAAAKYQAIADDASAPADLKEKATLQLAQVKEKQKTSTDAMKKLLGDAQKDYDAGKIDDADDAVHTIEANGADLGWQDNGAVLSLRNKINDKKMVAARTPAADAGMGAMAMAAAPGTAPASAMSSPMDMGPGMGTATSTAPAPGLVIQPGQPGALIQSTNDQNALLRDRALTLYKQAMKDSNDDLAANQYQQAIQNAQEALDLIDQNKLYFSDVELMGLHEAAQARFDNATTRYTMWKQQQQTAEALSTAHESNVHEQTIAEQRHQKVAALIADARKLYDAQEYREAQDLLRQASIIDPQDVNAALFLRMVSTKIIDRDYEAIMHRTGIEVMRQNIDSAEHLIPYADLMVYPDNWPEITRRRPGAKKIEDIRTRDSAENEATRDKLSEKMKDIVADNQPLQKLLDYIQNDMGGNVLVEWGKLSAVGVDKSTPVTINLHNVTYSTLLKNILSQLGNGKDVGYTVSEGIVTISTNEDLSADPKYIVYRTIDIRDMLVQPNPNSQPPSINLNSVGSNSGGGSFGSGGGGGGGGGFGGGGGGGFGGGGGGNNGGGGGGSSGFFNSNNQNSTSTNNAQVRQDLVNKLVDTIKAQVAPDTWRDAGGTIGSIREFNGQLLVTQTLDNYLDVYDLLEQLREANDIQIAVEVRLLLVSNNFLDDFRIGWDLSLPAGLIGSNVSATEFGNLNTFQQAAPQNTGVPGSIASFSTLPSLTLSASIIDNWTLSMLLQATQADRRTITVTAPRVTLFNGQQGWISVTNQQNIVTSFNQTVASGGINGGGAVGTQLNVSTLNTGVVLTVTATVSNDRRYVVMTIDPQLSTLDGIDTFTISNSTGNNTTSGNNSTAALGGAFVQLPKTATTEVSTMVSIPDGGTLLIGGQKLIGEAEVEVGVPILSKIPGLNRLFTNRSYVKDERTLLVLVRPNIIIHRELEDDLFGPNYDKPTGLPGNTGEGSTPAPLTVGGM